MGKVHIPNIDEDGRFLNPAVVANIGRQMDAAVGVEPPADITFSSTQPIIDGIETTLAVDSPVTWTAGVPIKSAQAVGHQFSDGQLGMAFTAWGTSVAVRLYCRAAPAFVQIKIDGRLFTTRAGTQVQGATQYGRVWMHLTFDTNGPHRVELTGQYVTWAGIAHQATGYVAPAPEPASHVRLVVLGDSWVGGALGITPSTTWPARLGELLTMPAAMISGQGGTGYVNTGPGNDDWTQDFGDSRRLDPIIAAKPTDVLVFGSVNDTGRTPTEIKTAAKALFAKLATAIPGIRIHVVVAQPTTAEGDAHLGKTANRQAVREAAQESTRIFSIVDGVAEGWFTANNRALFLGSDNVHPTQVGHDYVAARVAERLRPALVLGAQPLPIFMTYAADDFNRVDGPAGSTPSGNFAWTSLAGDLWAISGNRLTAPATASGSTGAKTVVDAGQTDVEVEATISGGNWGAALLFRTNADGSGYGLQHNSNKVELVNHGPTGGGTVITSWSPGAADSFTFKVRCAGDTLTVYRNGLKLGDVTDATHKGTRYGIRSQTAGRAMDNFKVTSIPA